MFVKILFCFICSKTVWERISATVDLGLQYLSDNNISKRFVAQQFTAKISKKDLQLVYMFLKDIRGLSQELKHGWDRLRQVYRHIWTHMLNERDTKRFYQQVREDWLYIHNANATNANKIYEVWADNRLHDLSLSKLKAFSLEELDVMMNADFANTIIEEKLAKIDVMFNKNDSTDNVLDILGNAADMFQEAMDQCQESLYAYLLETTIDSKFVM